MKLLSPAWGGGQTFHNTATEVGKFPFAPFLFLNPKCENGTFINTARSAEVDPPRTWDPSVGSRVRGCVILEYLKRGQHGSAAVCR